MKVYDSGMPKEEYWESLFNIEAVLSWMNPESLRLPVIEVGGGYGTFTLPLAQRLQSKIVSYDIEEEMIKRLVSRSLEKNITNIIAVRRDVLEHGFDEPDEGVDAVMLFNILHFSGRKSLLQEAKRVISKNGKIFIIHWRKDIDTPRGPSLDIRPTPSDIMLDIKEMGLYLCQETTILEPYHWGMILGKRN